MGSILCTPSSAIWKFGSEFGFRERKREEREIGRGAREKGKNI